MMKYHKLHYNIAEGIATGENVTVQGHSCRGGAVTVSIQIL
jgi:hypothetical protein